VSWNDDIIADFRAHGRVTTGPMVGRDLLLLTAKGAKTGIERTNPVAFSRDAGDLVVVASKNGAPTHPAWFHNLRKNPIVTVELGGERFTARAIIATPEAERRRLYDQHTVTNPRFREYEMNTTRRIPVIRLQRIA
jgi:deazaflavin-dependent oxidoreductase (nitroreductase family)